MTIVDELHRASEQEWLTAWLVGPTRIRLNNLPPQIGDPAPDLELPDTTGKRRRLSEFWQTRPALLLSAARMRPTAFSKARRPRSCTTSAGPREIKRRETNSPPRGEAPSVRWSTTPGSSPGSSSSPPTTGSC